MSVQPYADETIVLDSGSQDKTLEIANRYTDKIYFREFELRENYFITLRECCKWKVRQAATSLRVALKFWFAELPIYSNIVTESRYVSGFSKYSLRS